MSLPDLHRLLPQSPDAEKGILSSILIHPDIIDLCEEKGVSPASFHIPAHACIYEEVLAMRAAGKAIDIVTLSGWLRSKKKLDMCGGAAFITELMMFVPTAANAAYYIEIVLEKRILREVIRVAAHYLTEAYNDAGDTAALLEGMEVETLKIGSEKIGKDDYQSVKELVIESVSRIGSASSRKGKLGGISTGFTDIDRMTDGLHDESFYVLAGRPSSGKTSLAMNMAERIAVDQNLPVAIFSLEMSKQQLVDRLLLGRAGINWSRFREGYEKESDASSIARCANQIAAAPIHIIDKSGISPAYLRAVLRRWIKKFGIKVAFIDYLQLLRGSKNYKGDNRQQEVAEISSGLKALAKELGIPIVVLAQLNRDSEKRTGSQRGVPRLADLRESGAIEQDADFIGLIHRPEMFAEDEEEIAKLEGRASLIIAKQRSGPTGEVPLTFLKEFTRFESYAGEHESV